MKTQAHVSEKKINEVNFIKENLEKYKVIALADLTNLPSAQLESLKSKIKDKALIRVTKKRLIKIAISDLKNANINKLIPCLENCIPALIFTNEDPFSLYKLIKKNKSNTFAKPGQISPIDITIQPGPTNFPPGPIIGELGQAGIIAAVEAGKVTIKKEVNLLKKGEIINSKVADVLAKLKIEPIEIGLNIIASIQDGILYSKEILDIDEETYLNNIKLAYQEAFNLSINIAYITEDNIEQLLKKGIIEAKTLVNKQSIFTSDNLIDDLRKAEIELRILEEKAPKLKEIPESANQSKEELLYEEEKEEKTQEEQERKVENIKETIEKDQIGYTDETVKVAQDILSKLQDEKAKKMKLKKEKGFWD